MFDGLAEAFATMVVALFVAGVAVGAFLMWFIPILWGWVKPFIHAVTA